MKNLQITPMITNRDEDSLDIYLNNISKEKSITPEDEKELARRIHHGDKQALDKLVRANLRFVVSVAKKYQDQGMGLSDLISEGNIGLVKAAEAFDETMNVKFISYAVWWIRQSIMQALTDYPSKKLLMSWTLTKTSSRNCYKPAVVTQASTNLLPTRMVAP